MLIEIREANGFDADLTKVQIPTQAYQPPQLAVADHLFTSEVDGSMKLGIPIQLKFALQNTGNGLAKDVKVLMKLEKNVFSAGEKQFIIGDLKRGEHEEVMFEFFTNKRYEGSEVNIELIISENSGDYGMKEILSVRLNEELDNQQQLVVKGKKKEVGEIESISLVAEIDRNLPTTKMKQNDAFAVVIGNKNYKNTKAVKYAHNDARSIKKYLTDVMGFKEGNIFYEEDASLSKFRSLFGTDKNPKGKLYDAIKPNKSDVFIFYAGHGAPGLGDQKAYFVPSECAPNQVEINGYSLDVFYKNLNELQAKSITVVLDACFSGSGILENISSIVPTVKTGAGIKNGVVLSSSANSEVSTWYEEKEHGLFTYFFLKAIHKQNADTNKDGQLTMGEIYQFVSDKTEGVPYYARRFNGLDQNPTIMGSKDKVLIKY